MAAQNGDRASQVRIQLRSKDGEIELPQGTGPILVPTEVKRYQLSTLVNNLLQTDKPIPLEFLINGQFLRTSIDDFLTQNGISAETTLHVEYVKALVPPLHVASYEHDDWISSVDVLSQGSAQNRILSASFDGSLRIWNESAEVVATGQTWHRGSVQSAKFISPTQIISAGNDRSLRIWDFEDSQTGKGKVTPKLELCGHKGVIDRVAVHAPTNRIVSASTQIGLWSTKKSEGPAYTAPEITTTSSKRRKMSGPSISTPQRGPLAMLEGHQQPVKDITFDSNDPTVAYSASMDHSVKTWDLTTSTSVDTKTTNQSLFSICHIPSHSLVAAGGALNRIDLIDLRASATKVVSLSCRGHRNWVRAISTDPHSTYQFVSASDDSTCKIWDLRSTAQEAGGGNVAKPVYSIERESQKEGEKVEQGGESTVYDVVWDGELGIVSGGQDKRVQINKAP